MNDIGRMAKRAGVLYLIFALVAILGEFFFPAFVVTGDAAATARNIVARESLYRLSILIGFATVILHYVGEVPIIFWLLFSGRSLRAVR